jgi:hypothetical protein
VKNQIKKRPNNSLKLTRRAAPLGPLARPAGKAHNPGESARFRRAAHLEAVSWRRARTMFREGSTHGRHDRRILVRIA